MFLSVSVCMWVYVCLRVYVCVYFCMCMQEYMFVGVCLCVYISMCLFVYVCVCDFLWVCMYMFTYVSVYLCVCVYECVCDCLYVYMCLCVCECVKVITFYVCHKVSFSRSAVRTFKMLVKFKMSIVTDLLWHEALWQSPALSWSSVLLGVGCNMMRTCLLYLGYRQKCLTHILPSVLD